MTGAGTPNPFPLILPESLVLGQLSASLGSFIKATAWEVGEMFDAVLAPAFGADWLSEQFGGVYTPNLHDPDFVFDWHSPDSILWQALPPYSADLKNRFGNARRTRNRWEHEAAKQNVNSFLNGVDQLRRLADPLSLDVASYGPALLDRAKLLHKAGGVLPPSESELELQRRKEQAEEARREAEEALKMADEAAAVANQLGVRAAEDLKAKEQAMQQLAQAKADLEKLERELALAGRVNRQAVTEPADDLEPGAPWGELPLGIRTLTLKANMVDLMDRTTQTLLSQQMGSVASDAAARWLEIIPGGGLVHLTPAGHAAGQVNGVYLYLGRLDFESKPGAPNALHHGGKER